MEHKIKQIKGKGNGAVAPEFRPNIIEFLNRAKLEVTGDLGLNYIGVDNGVYYDALIIPETIQGNLKLSDKPYTFPKRLEVRGDLELNSLSTELPEEVIVGGNLKVLGTFFEENKKSDKFDLKKLTVKGDAFFESVANSNLVASKVEIGGKAYFKDCGFTVFPENLIIKGEVKIVDFNEIVFPSNFENDSYVIIHKTDLVVFGKNNKLHNVYTSRCKEVVFPEEIKEISGTIYLLRTQMNQEEFKAPANHTGELRWK